MPPGRQTSVCLPRVDRAHAYDDDAGRDADSVERPVACDGAGEAPASYGIAMESPPHNVRVHANGDGDSALADVCEARVAAVLHREPDARARVDVHA